MFKLLLCLRYLRTRYIALASIISVTLGVATMIVVNSVMCGFQSEMHKRLHGILSDIVVEAHSLEGIQDPDILQQEIRHVLGDDLQGMTATVHIPAMISFRVRGQWMTKQVNLIGIDDATYASVSDFSKYLLHPENRQQISFQLREEGYDSRMGVAGWEHRRARVAMERAYQRELGRMQRQQSLSAPASSAPASENREAGELASAAVRSSFPESVADPSSSGSGRGARTDDPADRPTPEHLAGAGEPSAAEAEEAPITPVNDPFAQLDQQQPESAFDEMTQQRTGIVLGIAISNIRHRNAENEVVDLFLCKPGDDVKVTFPTAGTPPTAVNAEFTVVDFYESKMSEYDAGFAFVPISALQQMRGMIDPQSGTAAVSSIQLKLQPGADLNAARDKLRARFPAELFAYRIQTWKELQGPLLAAVQMETTILNILLFLIIAVAGFGILATFFMIVVEKTRDIGILKSLGAPRSGVMSIFLSYGLSLGCVGSGAGLVLGLLFVININRIAALLERITGREVFDPTVYYFQEIPTIIQPFTIGWIVTGAMAIAVLASILPALRAARMHPVEALRYE